MRPTAKIWGEPSCDLGALSHLVEIIAFDSWIDSNRRFRTSPEVFILWADLDVLNAVEICRRISAEFSGAKLLIICDSYHLQKYSNQLKRSGANGFCQRSAGVRQLVAAVEAALRGEDFFPPILTLAKVSPTASMANRTLTSRELDVVKFLKSRNVVIAKKLEMKLRTVEKHIECILAKLTVPTRQDAILKAEQSGLQVFPPIEEDESDS